MKKIKFRGLTANGDWVYGDLRNDLPNSTIYYSEYSQRVCWDHSNQPVKNGTVGQYTGLKDKNGVEIYEGDIVRVFGGEYHQYKYEYDFEGVIRWQGMGFDVVKDDTGQGFGYYGHDENIEVVGNIHDK